MGKVYLAGAGPGDPELLTLKAHRVLQAADVVLHDSLVGPSILKMVRPGAQLIDVGKRCGGQAVPQSEINRLLVARAREGGVVVRLKGGDPMIFGRADEELAALEAAGIDYEIIPGVTTATAAAAALKLSLTRRGQARALHILTGHGAGAAIPAHDWVALARAGGTLVVYMGAVTMAGIAAHLIEAGMNPALPAVAVENATSPEQRILHGTVASLGGLILQAAMTGPVIILLGAALRRRATANKIALAALQET